ncbi:MULTISPECIES: glucokinase [unclassified Shinella]|uniref:glucokinase n=1 Tax=unclassified Shinella TaxID=2643062 RepID=UPI00225D8387|nr:MULTISPECIES: glucokinase [unclassified Shinella]MCO5141356.1 glucokinase [Shinella sp.]MDC7256731.1 glucokinase [Shinella sp. YE25]CAI0339611.1 Glucokinase [Rhizobiaceae bacterium]CAK7258007.1 Glucokinase [Shinella sp. WSC3-e]
MLALACDIGGTNTRLGLVRDGILLSGSTGSYSNDDFEDFYAVAATFLHERGTQRVDSVCIALAAVATAEGATLTNRDWTIARDRVAAASGAGRVDFINDFEALGYAMGQVEKLKTQRLTPGRAHGRPGPRLVLGAGTGFNASAWCPSRFGGAPHVVAAECGHMTLPLAGEAEFSLQGALSVGRGRASVERALSGRGLFEIYQWQCAEAGRVPSVATAADVSRLAVTRADRDCEQAGHMFMRLLGRVCGDLALAYLPFSGVYLSGGVSRAFARSLSKDPTFLDAFRAKGRQADFMESFPVHLLLDDRTALQGCAEWLRLSAA